MNFGKRLIPTGTCRLVFPVLVLGLTQSSGCAPSETGQQPFRLSLNPLLTAQASGVEARLIGISPVDENTVWIGGTGGTYARTTDGGTTWHAGVVPDTQALQFRDVHAVDAETAYLLSVGEGEQSRIYKTMNAGLTWALQFTNPEPQGFFDCMDFWDAEHGIAFSDSFGGRSSSSRPGTAAQPGRGYRPTSFHRPAKARAALPQAAPASSRMGMARRGSGPAPALPHGF